MPVAHAQTSPALPPAAAPDARERRLVAAAVATRAAHEEDAARFRAWRAARRTG